jgi:hypothetical protein
MRPDEDHDDYDEDVESQEIDYDDDDDDSTDDEDALEDERPITDVDIFGDISDMIDDTGDSCCRPKTSRTREGEEERSRGNTIDFSLLKGDELLLPYSYIISDREQWEHVLRACETGFRYVKDLGKVSDKVVRLVADVAALVLERGGGTNTNERFVQYAEQRGV